jgi:hypothetical protein
MSPTPRFFSNVKRDNYIVTRTIIAASGDGRYVIDTGESLPTTGMKSFKVGDVVPVAVKGGKPIVIIGHQWRRAQYAPIEEEAVAGDLINVFADSFDGKALLVFTSFLQGDFAVDLTPYGVPDGARVQAVFCQNNPSIVAVEWHDENFPNPFEKKHFTVLRILDGETGQFTPTAPVGTLTYFTLPDFDPIEISAAQAELVSSFTLAENDVVIRTLRMKWNYVWVIGTFKATICYTDNITPTLDTVAITSLTHEVITEPHVLEKTGTFGPRLDEFDPIACVEIDGTPQVFVLTRGESTLTPITWPAFDFSASMFRTDGGGGTVPCTVHIDQNAPVNSFVTVPPESGGPGSAAVGRVTIPDVVLDIIFGGPRSVFSGAGFGPGRHLPFYVINAGTREVVYRTLAADTLVEWTNHLFPANFSAGSLIITQSCDLPSSAFLEFQPQTSAFSLSTPDQILSSIRILSPPNPLTSQPWTTEATRRPSGSPFGDFDNPAGNFLQSDWRLRYSAGTSPIVTSTLTGKSVGAFTNYPGNIFPRMTEANFANTHYLQSRGVLKPVLFKSEVDGVVVDVASEWNGASLTDIMSATGGQQLRFFNANERYVALGRAFPLLGFLYDRETASLRQFSADAATQFPPDFFGNFLLTSERRLAYVGNIDTPQTDKGLLQVSFGALDVTLVKSDELGDEPEEETFPLTLQFGDHGATSAVFPPDLEDLDDLVEE